MAVSMNVPFAGESSVGSPALPLGPTSGLPASAALAPRARRGELRLVARPQDGASLDGRAGVDAAVAVQAAVPQRVEEREEPVVVLLRDGVELVIVALGAAEGQAEDTLAERLHAVGVVIR